MSLPTLLAARRWLAEADPDPDHARLWWDAVQVALLPLGYKWEAVKVGGNTGPAVAAAGVEGPVIRDYDACYFLVPLGTTSSWNVPGTECLGDTCYVSVPAPHRVTPPGPYWLCPPDGSGTLVDPEHLRAALTETSTP